MRKTLTVTLIAIIGIGIWKFTTLVGVPPVQSEAERLVADAKARTQFLQADAEARARVAAKVAAKTAEQRAVEQQAWDSAFHENYNQERDARWRQLTSPH